MSIPGGDDRAAERGMAGAERFIRADADEMHRRTVAYIDTFSARREELAELPRQLGNWPIQLTRDEARELGDAVNALVSRYRREPHDPKPRKGTERAYFQFQLIPAERAE